MSEKNSKQSKKSKKCKIKCQRCEFYDPSIDYCNEKDIEDCSKQTHMNFSSCDSFLIKEELAYF